MTVTEKKIAVCLPSYNEAENIENITKKIDKALSMLEKKYKCYIVNADNNSPDKTSELFINTITKTEKISIISKEVGKGINIIEFFKFCKNEDIDYAFIFDSDLKSFKINWIKKMLRELKHSDFICPLYKRGRFEGNSTNHFVVPMIGVIYNKIIRQPIGGDYGVNKKFIKKFLDSFDNNEDIKKYGIDIYLVLLALTNNFTIKQVRLGEKIHGLSYMKMDKIFIEVAKSLTTCVKILPKVDNVKENKWIFNSISRNKKCEFNEFVKNNSNYKYNESKEKWLKELTKYVKNIKKSNNEIDYQKMKETFMEYTFSYWTKHKRKSANECEKSIKNFYIELKERCEKNVS